MRTASQSGGTDTAFGSLGALVSFVVVLGVFVLASLAYCVCRRDLLVSHLGMSPSSSSPDEKDEGDEKEEDENAVSSSQKRPSSVRVGRSRSGSQQGDHGYDPVRGSNGRGVVSASARGSNAFGFDDVYGSRSPDEEAAAPKAHQENVWRRGDAPPRRINSKPTSPTASKPNNPHSGAGEATKEKTKTKQPHQEDAIEENQQQQQQRYRQVRGRGAADPIEEQSIASEAPRQATPQVWVEKFSKKHGRKYWVHSLTKERTWREPPATASNSSKMNRLNNR